MWWTRIRSLIVKEFLALMRDPRGRIVLIVPPVLQLVIFTYAATLEVHNADIMVLDRDTGHWSEELIRRIEGASSTFRDIYRADRPEDIREAIDRERVIAAVEIGPTFSRDIEAGRAADIAFILDGRRSNASQIVASYLTQIVGALSQETPAGRRLAPVTASTVPRNWFNPNLEFRWFMVPNLVASIALLMGILVTALSVARERELGTFDQLIVSPLRTHEILIGKLTPPMLIGLFHVTLFVLAAHFLFAIPLRGHVVYLYVSAFFYLLSVIGIGLFISSLSTTQQQAILGAFLFMVPAMLLSGFATPIENMPAWLQPVTYLNPLRYFLIVIRGVFLKDMAFVEVVRQTMPLALISIVTLGLSAKLFRSRLE